MIFEAAGRVGVDPSPFSWRQLDDMDHGRRREEWQKTGDICHAIAQSQTKTRVPVNLFNRYHQQFGNTTSKRKIKPSEVDRIA